MNKKSEYCPEWFDLKNYEPCKTFSRRAWTYALITRILIYQTKNWKEKPSEGFILENWTSMLIQYSSYEHLNLFNGEAYQDNVVTNFKSDQSISNCTVISVSELYFSIKEKHPNFFLYLDDCAERAKVSHLILC